MRNETAFLQTLQSDFTLEMAGLPLSSPILNASGAFNPQVFSRLFPLKDYLGAVVTKTITPNASSGNAQQRTVELKGVGMLNSIGLQGKGIVYSMAEDIPDLFQHHTPIILSISAESETAFSRMTAFVEAHANRRMLAGIELNVSCPNVHAGGAIFGSSPEWVAKAVRAVKQETTLPLWVKLTPNTSQFVAVGCAAVDAGADALTAINTVLGSHIDIKRRCPSLAKVSGGYSGIGIKPIAIHHVIQLAKALPHIPIVGVGGIRTAEDVLEFIMAGCSAVQVGTHAFESPTIFVQLLQELDAWCKAEGISSLQSLKGVAL